MRPLCLPSWAALALGGANQPLTCPPPAGESQPRIPCGWPLTSGPARRCLRLRRALTNDSRCVRRPHQPRELPPPRAAGPAPAPGHAPFASGHAPLAPGLALGLGWAAPRRAGRGRYRGAQCSGLLGRAEASAENNCAANRVLVRVVFGVFEQCLAKVCSASSFCIGCVSLRRN